MLGSVARAVGQTKPNHLAGEPSPYPTRAMNQPVNWYPWGKDAFGRAEDLNVPILLDVGAVWCPWCILMDRDTYTNVGLSIAKWIAEAHQGKISVVSKVGEGSVFRVQIPLSEDGL